MAGNGQKPYQIRNFDRFLAFQLPPLKSFFFPAFFPKRKISSNRMVFRIFRRFFWGKNNAAPRPNVVKIVNFTLLFLEAIYLLSMRSDRPELARRSTSEKTAYSWFTYGVLDPLNMTFWGFFNPFSHRKNRKIAFFGAPPKYGKSWQKLAKVGKIWQKLTTVFQADFPKIGPVFSKFGRFSQNRPFFKRVHPFFFFS